MSRGEGVRRLVVLCPYPQDVAPSQRFKFEQYYAAWRDAGWRVEVHPFWDERGWRALYAPGRAPARALAFVRGLARRRRAMEAALAADLVWLHLEAVPLGPPWLERRIARAGVPLVYDVDDLVHLPHASRANPFMRRLRSPDKVPELMELADHVVVCTEHLRRLALEHNDAVTSIPSTIDLDRYRPRDRGQDAPSGDGRVVVGWTGSHSTSPYLHLLDDVLRELQRSEHVRVRVIGDASFRIPGVELTATDWRSDTEVRDLSEIDVGLYPLPHEEWVLGKSGLKALQYMALAVPVVAEDVGAARTIVDDGRSGFLVRGEDAWLDALRALVRDPGLRRRVGAAGRRTVEERYSVAANVDTYLRVAEDAARPRGAPEPPPPTFEPRDPRPSDQETP